MSIRTRLASCARGTALGLAACLLPFILAASQALPSIAGVVVSPDGQPIRRAIVRLTGPDLPLNLSAVTDDQGSFVFVNLKPGSYGVSASKPAYLTTELGARRPGRSGTPLALGPGERVTGLRLTLARGAVLSGVVRDASGTPAPNITISIAPAASLNDATSYPLPREGSLLTDDRGFYRAFGLMPGEYVVAAAPRLSGSGTVVRLNVPTIDAAMRDLQQRTSGRAAGAASATPLAPPPLTYAPVFYPGTPLAQDAARIRVAAGEVRDGLDFTIDLVPSAAIAGSIAMGDGSPLPGVQMSLTQIGPPMPALASIGRASRQSTDGTFSYANVTPGRYILFARGTPGTAPISTSAGRGGLTFGGGPEAVALWALADLTVSGVDLSGITLTMRPSLKFMGRVVFDAASKKPPADLTKVLVGLRRPEGSVTQSVNGAAVPGLPPPPAASVQPDGNFVVNSVLPAAYMPTGTVSGDAGWWLRSAVVSGRDVLDFPLDFGPAAADVSGAVLTFSDRRSELSGTLQSASGRAATEYVVIVFPADRTLWQSSRRLRSTRPASDGRFAFVDLPAGDYLIAALADVDLDDWRRAAFLEQAAGASVKVVIADGATVRQNIGIR